MYEFIYLLKTIAAILITNSHFDNLYPISALSIGGSLGNTLFFLVSGFLISERIECGLRKWYFARCKRLYPSYWIINGIYVLLGIVQISSISDIIGRFIIPVNSFWFIGAILIFYFLFYFVIKSGKKYLNIWIGLSVAVYFIAYVFFKDLSQWSIEDSGYFKFIYYFVVMLVGYYMKSNVGIVDKFAKKRMCACIDATVISIIAFLLTKVAMLYIEGFSYFQFLVQLTTLSFGVFCFLSAFSFEKKLKEKACTHLSKILHVIGSSTLEIYLVNYVVANWAQQLPFPINIVIAFCAIFVIGIGVHYFVNTIFLRKIVGNCLVRRK